MKWTLLTLFCLYLGVYQQQQVRRLYLPFYYYQPQISRYSNQGLYVINHNNGFIQPVDYDIPTELKSSIYRPITGEYDNEATDLLQWTHQTQPRVPAALLAKKIWPKKNNVSTSIVNAVQEDSSVRLFFNGVNWLSFLQTSTTTTTVLTTVTSTMTTFTMKSCATSTQFVSPIKACRRRRNTQIAERLVDRANSSPAQFQSVVSSVPPPSISQMHDSDFSHPLIKMEIESSQLQIENPYFKQQEREKRLNRIVLITSATTVTLTTYTMNTTTLTTSITLGATTAVFCLPSGITIC